MPLPLTMKMPPLCTDNPLMAIGQMEEAGWLKSRWDTSENNRRARFYAITRKGRTQLRRLEEDWARHVSAVERVLKLA